MSGLELIYQQKVNNTFKRPIYLFCVFRDEYLLLDYFIKYYKAIGVTHFIMINNLSVDSSVEYLKQLKDINIDIYNANNSYREAAYGTSWVNELLTEYCKNQYCFTVDVDELFYLNNCKYKNLEELIVSMESQESNVVFATLLDMYPEVINNGYKKGESFLNHSPFYDQYNPVYYKNVSVIYKKCMHKTGGMRKRVFGKTVCIHKFPFFKYDFSPVGLAAGYHFFQKSGEVLVDLDEIKPFEHSTVLLHFKFIKPHLDKFFKRRVVINQDWDDSSEYKAYAEAICQDPFIELFNAEFSKKITNAESLEVFNDTGLL